MNKIYTLYFISLFVISTGSSVAQDYSNAGLYMQYFSDQQRIVSKDMWDYMSAIARGKNARKVENRRKELLKSMLDAKRKIAIVKPFKGDGALRDSMVSFMILNYNILHEDYDKIVDLEEIAEQSFDQMEAYITVRKKANEKMNAASDALESEQKRFAAANNINLVDDDSKLGKKLERAGKAFDYYDELFLIYFKSNVQESHMVDAQNKSDLNAMEQNKNALLQYTEEGMKALSDLKPFNGDASLITTCKSVFTFYKKEAGEKVPVIIDFYLKKENFDKIKSAMDAKGKSATQEDVDKYNASMKEYNGLVNKFNTINNELNKERSMKIDTWNDMVKSFLDKHAS